MKVISKRKKNVKKLLQQNGKLKNFILHDKLELHTLYNKKILSNQVCIYKTIIIYNINDKNRFTSRF